MVAETLRNNRGRGCSLLVGAGCSATADIPLASGIVQEFEKRYPNRYANVPIKTYPHCMGQLAYNERSDLIAPFIDRARINWAHMAIAQLTKAGYVTRILTTNFDPLIVKACATVGVFPAIYDFAASQMFRADRVYEPSVFYLHGQRAGFVTLHTEEEVQRLKQTLGPVFEDAGRGRAWIVCGYSGDNDPVFEHLAEVPTFGSNLYWVGFKDTPPSEHVKAKLLIDDKYAFYVPGYDADSFFVELARLLECFPPAIVAKPFTHLLEVTDLLAPFALGPETGDLRQAARTRIQAAIDQFEQGESKATDANALQPDALDASTLLFSGKYDEVLALFERTPNPSDEMRDAAAWALVAQASALADQAPTTSGAEADRLWGAAYEKYESALRVKPDKHEALYNWGWVLDEQARTKSGAEADGLWDAAYDKYEGALRIKPDMEQALNNWGLALAAQARTKSGAEADALWAAAYERYERALRIKPDKHEALNNWGSAFLVQAAGAADKVRKKALIESAISKCENANEIVPGIGSYNLACAYILLGDGEACKKWLTDAREYGKLPSRVHMSNDSDLSAVRELPWFRQFLTE